MSEAILKINDLKVNYGGIEAVKGISFDVPAGEIITLIGANGAGKSSTLRAIAGLVKPASGNIALKATISPARIRPLSSPRASRSFPKAEKYSPISRFWKTYASAHILETTT